MNKSNDGKERLDDFVWHMCGVMAESVMARCGKQFR
jgi:hypothetical protein